MCSSLRVCAPTACLYRGLSTMGVLHGFVGSTGFQTDDGQLRGVVRVADSGRLGMRPPISKSCPSDLERNTARAQPLQFVALIVVVHQVDATSRRVQLWSSFVKSVTIATRRTSSAQHSVLVTRSSNIWQENKKGQAHTSFQERFAYIQSLTQLEIRLRNYDGIGTVRAEDNSNTASPNITFKKAVSKGVKLGNTKERRTRYITNVSDSKAEHEDIAVSGTTSRPHKTRRTFRNITAQGQNEKHCGSGFWIAHVHKTGRVAAEQKKPECSLGLSLPEKQKEMWEEHENKHTTSHLVDMV